MSGGFNPFTKVAMHWKADDTTQACSTCAKPFNPLTRRRHHCRACGAVCCDVCAPEKAMVLPEHFGCGSVAQRVCTQCQMQLPQYAGARKPGDTACAQAAEKAGAPGGTAGDTVGAPAAAPKRSSRIWNPRAPASSKLPPAGDEPADGGLAPLDHWHSPAPSLPAAGGPAAAPATTPPAEPAAAEVEPVAVREAGQAAAVSAEPMAAVEAAAES
jgi:hypothetical protein